MIHESMSRLEEGFTFNLKRMKKIFFSLLFVIASLSYAQNKLAVKVKDVLMSNYPQLALTNKLLLVVKEAGTNDQLKKELQRTSKVYEVAKLDGGKKGLVSVVIVNDLQEELMLKKEGLTNVYFIRSSDLQDCREEGTLPILYSNENTILAESIPSHEIFTTINHLITR